MKRGRGCKVSAKRRNAMVLHIHRILKTARYWNASKRLMTSFIMISCDIVGKVSSVIVNVSPTLSSKGLHDWRNTFSSWLSMMGLPPTGYGDLEKSREFVVTLDANSNATFNIEKHISPTASRGMTKKVDFIILMLLNMLLVTTSSAAVTYTGSNTPNASIAQAWKCWMARYFKRRAFLSSAVCVPINLVNAQMQNKSFETILIYR